MSDATAWRDIRRFYAQIGIALCCAGLVATYPVYAWWGADVLLAASAGCGISTANVLLGGASVVWALDKPQPVFLKVVLGGMAVRMAGVGVAFILMIRLTDLPVYGLAISLFLFYLLYQYMEIRFLISRNARPVQEEA